MKQKQLNPNCGPFAGVGTVWSDDRTEVYAGSCKEITSQQFTSQRHPAKNKFDFNDFQSQLKQIKKMGDIKSLINMIPGMSKMTKNLDIDDKAFNKVEAIIQSMTLEERAKPELLNMSRKRRIARGCGHNIHEINMFIKQFDQMRKMMHMMSKGKFNNAMGGGGMPGMPRS